MIPHVKISSLSDAVDSIVNVVTSLDEVLLEVVIFIFGIILTPLGLFIGYVHDFTKSFLSVTPVPGEEDADEFYIFSSPEEGNLFYTLNGFIDAYIEPIALLLIFFGIALLLFLRIFDIVIDDFGLDTTEAKQKLFIAPLLIVLWVPIANLVLYFSFGMTEFFNNFTFPGIEELGDSVAEGDALTDTGEGLTIQSYLSAIMPDSVIGTGSYDVVWSILTLILAYLAAIPAALIYLVALLGAFMRIILLYYLYIIGPIAITLWAFNWRDLAELGGKAIRWFILLAIMPIAVVFIDTIAPVVFLSMEQIVEESIAAAMDDPSDYAESFEALDEAGFADAGDILAPTQLMVIGFIIATPVLIGIIPWAIIIGFNKAMKIGAGVAVGAAGVATAGGALGAVGMAKGASAMSSMASGAAESGLTGVSGDALGTAGGMSLRGAASRMSRMRKQKQADFGKKLRESSKVASSMASTKWDEMGGLRGAEKMVANSKTLSNSTFGAPIQTLAAADVKRQEGLREWQSEKTKVKAREKAEKDKSHSLETIKDEDGNIHPESIDEGNPNEAMMREGEKAALKKKIEDDDKMKHYYAKYLSEKENDPSLHPSNLTDDEIDELADEESMIEAYRAATIDGDRSRFDVLGDSAEDMDEAIRTLSRSEVDDALAEEHDEKFYDEDYQEAKDEYLAREDEEKLGVLHNDLTNRIDGESHQAGFDEKVLKESKNRADENDNMERYVNNDTSKSSGKVFEEALEAYIKSGDVDDALSVTGINDGNVEDKNEFENKLNKFLTDASQSLADSGDIKLESISDSGLVRDADEFFSELSTEYEKAKNKTGPSQEALDNRNRTSAENATERVQAVDDYDDEITEEQARKVIDGSELEGVSEAILEVVGEEVVDGLNGLDTKKGLRNGGLDKALGKLVEESEKSLEELLTGEIQDMADSAGVNVDTGEKTQRGAKKLIGLALQEQLAIDESEVKEIEENHIEVPDINKKFIESQMSKQAKEFINAFEEGTETFTESLNDLDADVRQDVLQEMSSIPTDGISEQVEELSLDLINQFEEGVTDMDNAIERLNEEQKQMIDNLDIGRDEFKDTFKGAYGEPEDYFDEPVDGSDDDDSEW